MGKQGWSEAEIFQEFSEIVANSLRLERSQVTLDSHLDTELGAESLDLIEITMEVEAKFNVWLSEKNILDTAVEIFGEGVLVQDGTLTEEGKRLLKKRIPAKDSHLFDGEVTLKELQSYSLKIGTWVDMISRLLEQTPSSCLKCGGDLTPMTGFRMSCDKCSHQFALPSGEELNLRWVKDYYESVHSQPPQGSTLSPEDEAPVRAE